MGVNMSIVILSGGASIREYIELQTTAPYMPEQNGVAEQYNHSIIELACAMIFVQNLPNSLWPEATV